MSIIIGKNNYSYNISNINGIKEKRTNGQTQKDNKKAESLIKDGINLFISQKGFEMAEKLEPFEDTYEMTTSLLNGIGTKETINGTFMDVLSKNYQSKLKELEENYSDEEYQKQLNLLDKAYDEAAKSASNGYVKQLRILTGDIVLKPTTLSTSYSTEEEANKAYNDNLDKETEKKYVIDSEQAKLIQADLKEMLIKLKNGELNNSNQFLTKNDIQNIGNLFLNKETETDISGIQFSNFATSIIERYNKIYK